MSYSRREYLERTAEAGMGLTAVKSFLTGEKSGDRSENGGEVNSEDVDVPAENRAYVGTGFEEIDINPSGDEHAYGTLLLNLEGVGVELKAEDDVVRYEVTEPSNGSQSIETEETGSIVPGESTQIENYELFVSEDSEFPLIPFSRQYDVSVEYTGK